MKIVKEKYEGKYYPPLYEATEAGNVEDVRILLLEEGIDVNAADNHSWTPLHRASLCGFTEIVELLLARDEIKVNAKGQYRKTPLHFASQKGHTDVVKLLLVRDEIKVNAADKYGVTMQQPKTVRRHCGRHHPRERPLSWSSY